MQKHLTHSPEHTLCVVLTSTDLRTYRRLYNINITSMLLKPGLRYESGGAFSE